jgi:glyceraldehyde-3-phosphate dehydrogenase/erythrose-4-phosphate dehydrogenase
MNVVVRGPGNIGTTLANLLLRHRERLGIDEVRVLKERPTRWGEPDLELLRARGALVYIAGSVEPRHEPAFREVSFVFDCRKAGAPLRDRGAYEAMTGLGAVAQGSEAGFGVVFVAGVNGAAIEGERFVHVGSCNTHALAALLRALAGPRLEALEDADFVIVRRSEDLGSHERLVAASVVSRHRDANAGTHHAVDVARLFQTLGCQLVATSSDVTTPSQLMHATRFALRLQAPVAEQELLRRIDADPWLAITDKFDSNAIFELGRRYGVQGRIYSHAVVVASNLLITGRVVRGWAFVPQEGNTLVSTLESFLRQTRHPRAQDIAAELRADLLVPRW